MVLVLTRLVAALAALGVATAVTTAGTAGADPTPTPRPNYQIPTPNGPAFPGVQTYPPWCARNMLACGFTWSPSTGTWQPGG
jgi:hypothetical protein